MKNLNHGQIRCGWKPLDLSFMEEMFPMKKEPDFIVGDLKWGENDTVVFIQNPNGKLRMYIQ